MNQFHSDYLFGGFLVFVLVFFVIVLLDFIYHQCRKPYKSVHLLYGQHDTFRFHIKRRIARLLLAFGQRKHDPTLDVDRLQVFSDLDEMVRILFVSLSLSNSCNWSFHALCVT